MAAVIHLGWSSPTTSSDLPGGARGPRSTADPKARGLPPYSVLLQAGFSLPPAFAGAVRSYRTFSPLPSHPEGRAWAVCFLWHFP